MNGKRGNLAACQERENAADCASVHTLSELSFFSPCFLDFIEQHNGAGTERAPCMKQMHRQVIPVVNPASPGMYRGYRGLQGLERYAFLYIGFRGSRSLSH